MQDVRSQISYWNRVAREKRFSHPLRVDWLARHLSLYTAPSRILDLGCGYGRTLAELSRAGYQNLIGVDFAAGMLERCRNELPDAGLIRSDGRTLPLDDNSVDAVLLFAVLTCIPQSSEQESQIAEVARVLRPGGLVYISDLLVNSDERNRLRYEQSAERFGCYGVFELPEGVVVRHHREEWIAELTSSFAQLEYEPFEVTTMNGNSSAAFQYLGQKG